MTEEASETDSDQERQSARVSLTCVEGPWFQSAHFDMPKSDFLLLLDLAKRLSD